MLEIDGRVLEGGGQILRIASALSCLLKRPIKVYNIRGGRSKPGLRPQHLNGLQLLSNICNGALIGNNVGSTTISLEPGKIKDGDYIADTGTAGSIVLLLQVSLPCLLFAQSASQLLLKGGTDADMAPPVDYTKMVLKPALEKFGIKCHVHVEKRGFYPKGGGIVKASIEPLNSLKAVEIVDRGHVVRIFGCSYVAGNLPIGVSHAMADSVIIALKNHGITTDIVIERVKESEHTAFGTGKGIIVVAETSTGCRFAGTALGKPGMRGEAVAHEATRMLLQNLEHGGCVDDYLQDQLIIFMALAEGKSRIACGPITLHTETAIHVVHTMTEAKFKVYQDEDHPGKFIIECDGIGLKPET